MKLLSALLTLAIAFFLFALACWYIWDVNLLNVDHMEALWRALSTNSIAAYSTQLMAFLGACFFFLLVIGPAATLLGALVLDKLWKRLFSGINTGLRIMLSGLGRGSRGMFSPLRRLLLWRPPVQVRMRLSWPDEERTYPAGSSESTPSRPKAAPVMEIGEQSTIIADSKPDPEDDEAETPVIFGLQLDQDVRPASRLIPTLRDFFHEINYQCRLELQLDPSRLGDIGFTADEFGGDPQATCDLIAFGADQIAILQVLDLQTQQWTPATSLEDPEWQSSEGEVAPCPVYRAARAKRRFTQQFAGSLELAPGDLVAIVVIDNGTLQDETSSEALYEYADSLDVELVHLGAPGALESLFAQSDSPYPADKLDFISSLAGQIAA